MPVTAKLSRHFYDQLGDDIANELVDWFNAVDATYKADLERMNDLSWDRFRAENRAQFAEFRADMDVKFANVRAEVIKWMFAFWAGTVIPLAALMAALAR